MRKKRERERGSALLTAAALSTVLMLVLAGLVYYASRSRLRAISVSRGVSRISCADSGLQLARAYFGRNNALWNTTFLPNPAVYNAANAIATDATARANLINTHPELFADLDGDGLADVYLYVRDNMDEFLPNPNNLSRDNDLNVIIGAMCTSSTLLPRTEDGRLADPILAEGLLSFNPTGSYGSQGYHGASGSGNLNSF
ncbi:MAG TPA: hypothetical protein VKE49_10030 [Myxococcaceae bacterium]|nr:hypothetical protein [Myxococcaceae bacterium]